MPQHFDEIKPTERPTWLIALSVSSYRLNKIIVRISNRPRQEDRLDLEGKILSPDELRGHKINVELYKREEPQPPLIEGYEAIGMYGAVGRFFFMRNDLDDPRVEIGRIAPPGYFAATLDVDCKIFDDIANMLVALEGRDGIERELLLNIIGLLNNWDLEGYLPLTRFHLTVKSKPTIPQSQQDEEPPPVKLIPPLIFHGEY